MNKWILLLLIGCTMPALAQKQAKAKKTKGTTVCWAGSLSDGTHLFLKLTTDKKGKLWGESNRISNRFSNGLSGKKDGTSIQFDEWDGKTLAGTFTGNLLGDSLTGMWKAPSGEVLEGRFGKSSPEEFDRSLTIPGPDRITNEELKRFVAGFSPKTLPFALGDLPYEDTVLLDSQYVDRFLGWSLADLEEWGGYTDFHPWAVAYYDRFILLIVVREWTPGAFGIYNDFIDFYTVDYAGNLLFTDEQGCFCRDSDPGVNLFHYSESQITVEFGVVWQEDRFVTETMFPENLEEGEEASYEERTESSVTRIDPNGIIHFTVSNQ